MSRSIARERTKVNLWFGRLEYLRATRGHFVTSALRRVQTARVTAVCQGRVVG